MLSFSDGVKYFLKANKHALTKPIILGLIALLTAITMVLIYVLLNDFSMSKAVQNTAGWTTQNEIFMVLSTLLNTISMATIIFYVGKNDKQNSLINSFKQALKHPGIIIFVTLLYCFFVLTGQLSWWSPTNSDRLNSLIMLAYILSPFLSYLIIFLFSYLLPYALLDKLSIIESIKKSYLLVKKTWRSLLTGSFLFLTIRIAPLWIFIQKQLHQSATFNSPQVFENSSKPLSFLTVIDYLSGSYISVVFTIFITLMYLHYESKNKKNIYKTEY